MKKKVLIIENDDQIKDIVTYILENEGYAVEGIAHTPDDLQQLKADLILLDEWINIVEGHMLCKEIKNIPTLKHVPVIIFSTASNILDIVKTCGADGYVQKPFDLGILLTEIKKFLPFTILPKTA